MIERPQIPLWLYALAFMAFVVAALAGVTIGILWWDVPLGYL